MQVGQQDKESSLPWGGRPNFTVVWHQGQLSATWLLLPSGLSEGKLGDWEPSPQPLLCWGHYHAPAAALGMDYYVADFRLTPLLPRNFDFFQTSSAFGDPLDLSGHPLLLDIFSLGPPQWRTVFFLFFVKVSFEKHPRTGSQLKHDKHVYWRKETEWCPTRKYLYWPLLTSGIFVTFRI